MTMKEELKQTDIFSMFGIEDEATIKMEAAKAAAKKKHDERMAELKKATEEKKGSDSKAASSSPKQAPFKILIDTIVNYAGREMPVTNYFTVEEIENGLPGKKKQVEEGEDESETGLVPISENDLRKKLEEDYPELVANFTQLVYMEKKNIIIPILSAKKKGIEDCMEASAQAEVSCSSKKKIPFQVLADFIVIAKDFSDKFGTEIMADIYYDLQQDEFFMDIPKQIVNPVLCINQETAYETAVKFMERKYIKIMEIHSHHTMRAIPSSIDDANERSSILYAIIGRVDKLFPEITVRTFNKHTDEHITINPSNIFEDPFHNAATYLYDTSVVEVE